MGKKRYIETDETKPKYLMDLVRKSIAERVSPDVYVNERNIGSKIVEFINPGEKSEEIDDFSRDLWNNFLGQKNNLTIENDTVRLPDNLKAILKKAIDGGLEKERKSKIKERDSLSKKINRMIDRGDDIPTEMFNKMDTVRAKVNWLDHTLSNVKKANSGEPTVFNEHDFNVDSGGGMTPLSGLSNFTVFRDKEGKINVRDEYDFYSPEQTIPEKVVTLGMDKVLGKPFPIADKFKEGGEYKPSKEKIKSILEKVNKSDANFVNRLKDNNRSYISDWENPDYIATHKMRAEIDDEGNPFIFPDVQEIDGKLIDFTDPNIKNGNSWDNAIQRKDTVRFDTLEDAIWFSENYKNYYPSFDKYKDGGNIGNSLVDKQKHIYDRLIQKYDIPEKQAVAIIANLTHESGLNIGALGDNGSSFGIQQWKGKRRSELEDFAKKKGSSTPSLDDQVDFLMQEYNTGKAFQFNTKGQNLYKTKGPKKGISEASDYYQFSKSDFDNASNIYDATIAWNQGVGRPHKKWAMNDRRYEIAKNLAKVLGIKDEGEPMYMDQGFASSSNIDTIVSEKDNSNKEVSKEQEFFELYGKNLLAQALAYNPNQVIQKQEDQEEDVRRYMREQEDDSRERLISAFLPNIQLKIKGVTEIHG